MFLLSLPPDFKLMRHLVVYLANSRYSSSISWMSELKRGQDNILQVSLRHKILFIPKLYDLFLLGVLMSGEVHQSPLNKPETLECQINLLLSKHKMFPHFQECVHYRLLTLEVQLLRILVPKPTKWMENQESKHICLKRSILPHFRKMDPWRVLNYIFFKKRFVMCIHPLIANGSIQDDVFGREKRQLKYCAFYVNLMFLQRNKSFSSPSLHS